MARLHGKDKSKIDKYKRNLKKNLSFMGGIGPIGPMGLMGPMGGGCAVAELADGVLALGGRRRSPALDGARWCSMARLRLFLAGVVGVNEGVVVLLDFGGILGEATLLVGFYGFGEEFV